MAAEPAPPGPPDDSGLREHVADLESRVADLEYYRRHEAPVSSRAAGLGLEIVRQEAADLGVKLTRVIGRQDQAAALAQDMLAVQRDQADILARIGRVQERHGRKLDEHGGQLDEIRGALAEILCRLPPAAE